MQVIGHPRIFAIGDVTNIAEEKMAERALDHAVVVAKNLKNVYRGKPPRKKYSPPARLFAYLYRVYHIVHL